MEKLLSQVREAYPEFTFRATDLASWSSKRQEVSYSTAAGPSNEWSLLHELGHAILGHSDFTSDLDLIAKEVEAWSKAYELGTHYGISIDDEHVQQCLDTYRAWLHKRSTCPECLAHGLQRHRSLYACPNCHATWNVTNGRLCRPYRLKMAYRTQ
jgi:hypothetical protein